METHAEIIVKGMVQGVGFRWFVRRAALQLGLSGYVKNLPDESVYCEVEGSESMINEFVNELKAGPPLANITNVIVNEFPGLVGYKRFEIKF
ncbi:MAG: acylphosphatase [Candidatus Neomarinimicrobiota bacterium]